MIKLNQAAYDLAEKMIKGGLEIIHDHKNWDEVEATPTEAVIYLNNHGLEQYGTWFLGIDTDADPNDRSKFVYPFGDFSVVHESAIHAAHRKATKNQDHEVAEAAKKLLDLIGCKSCCNK